MFVVSQQELALRATSFELAIVCPGIRNTNTDNGWVHIHTYIYIYVYCIDTPAGMYVVEVDDTIDGNLRKISRILAISGSQKTHKHKDPTFWFKAQHKEESKNHVLKDPHVYYIPHTTPHVACAIYSIPYTIYHTRILMVLCGLSGPQSIGSSCFPVHPGHCRARAPVAGKPRALPPRTEPPGCHRPQH